MYMPDIIKDGILQSVGQSTQAQQQVRVPSTTPAAAASSQAPQVMESAIPSMQLMGAAARPLGQFTQQEMGLLAGIPRVRSSVTQSPADMTGFVLSS